MLVIDAQVHCWEASSTRYPWDPNYGAPGTPAAAARAHYEHAPMPVTQLIAAMDKMGIGAGLIVPPSIYGTDNSYSLATAAEYPDRFGVIGKMDERRPDLDEAVAQLRAEPQMLGIRVIITRNERAKFETPDMARLFKSAERHAMPICLYPPGNLDLAIRVADQYPNLQWVIDHLGLGAPPAVPATPEPFADIGLLLELAKRPNVTAKISGTPALSRERYPFRDLWPHLHRIIESFGIQRTMWGSDFTRVAELHSYQDAIAYVRDTDELSRDEKTQLLSGTLLRVFRWHVDSIRQVD